MRSFWRVRASNERALAFYRSLAGGKPAGAPLYPDPEEDAVLMNLGLVEIEACWPAKPAGVGFSAGEL